jgi:hypothetical protein
MLDKLSRHAGNVKRFISSGIRRTKNVLSNVDSAFRTGKDIYDIVEPIISNIAPDTTKNLNKHVKKGITDYENLRNKVMVTSEHATNNVDQVMGKLKKKKIKIPGIN